MRRLIDPVDSFLPTIFPSLACACSFYCFSSAFAFCSCPPACLGYKQPTLPIPPLLSSHFSISLPTSNEIKSALLAFLTRVDLPRHHHTIAISFQSIIMNPVPIPTQEILAAGRADLLRAHSENNASMPDFATRFPKLNREFPLMMSEGVAWARIGLHEKWKKVP
jgi:hypothetical protein